MPHECVSCGEVFDDGADEVFDGCPDCGATKFFYVKEVTGDEPTREPSPVEEQKDTSSPAESTAQRRARSRTHHPATDAEEDADGDSSGNREPTTEPKTKEDSTDIRTPSDPSTDTTSKTETETTQDTKRTTDSDDIVEADSEYDDSFGGKLEDTEKDGKTDETDQITSSGGRKFRRARPEEARRRLMDQFETIRIVEPGSYELNLMNLYEEDEKIIALQEDGRYQVSLPSTIDD